MPWHCWPSLTPTRQRLIVNDASVEKLGELLNENPNGMLLARDELIGWMREAMRPMSRPAPADLAAAIDDCFEHAESAQAGRQQAIGRVRNAMPSR